MVFITWSSVLILSFSLITGTRYANIDSETINPKILTELRRSRRILQGHEVGETMPYMVHLKRASNSSSADKEWLCGGVIIHDSYILTSAACIEDAKHFYVISGTSKWTNEAVSKEASDCIKYGAKRATWKCVPKNYIFDGAEFNNIKWMIDDIAVVKVEDKFDFTRKIKGCDFIPQMIAYNNQSEDMQKPGTSATIAGWGSTDRFGDTVLRNTVNSPVLLETDVVLMQIKKCKDQWPERYHYVIDNNMVCAKDSFDASAMGSVCNEQQVNCEELIASSENLDTRRNSSDSGRRHRDFRRKSVVGGFCENDHGGPLIVGRGNSAVVIGTITASQLRPDKRCRGPYLFTSTWKNRHLISCAVFKEMGGSTCQRFLRNSESHTTVEYDWSGHPQGPAKSNKKPDEYKEIRKKLMPPPQMRPKPYNRYLKPHSSSRTGAKRKLQESKDN